VTHPDQTLMEDRDVLQSGISDWSHRFPSAYTRDVVCCSMQAVAPGDVPVLRAVRQDGLYIVPGESISGFAAISVNRKVPVRFYGYLLSGWKSWST
jgi:hypothetical protein